MIDGPIKELEAHPGSDSKAFRHFEQLSKKHARIETLQTV
jgi:hypothetical protein